MHDCFPATSLWSYFCMTALPPPPLPHPSTYSRSAFMAELPQTARSLCKAGLLLSPATKGECHTRLRSMSCVQKAKNSAGLRNSMQPSQAHGSACWHRICWLQGCWQGIMPMQDPCSRCWFVVVEERPARVAQCVGGYVRLRRSQGSKRIVNGSMASSASE